MTVEDLLKVRYKVIADYPGSEYKVGELLTTDKGFWKTNDYKLCYPSVENFPHLFRKLEWWEDRKIEDMPQYVKCTTTPDQIHFPNRVYQLRILNGHIYDTKGFHIIVSTNCYLPATQQEYEAQFIG